MKMRIACRSWRNRGWAVVALLAAAWGTRSTTGQMNAVVGQTAAVPTTVQLPTFHYFSTTGSVVVPDGGDAFLGGVDSSAAGRTEQGIPGLPSRPLTNTAIGSSAGASNVSVNAQIHDFEAMDQALLDTATSDTLDKAGAGILGTAEAGRDFHPPLLTSAQLAATKIGPVPLQSVAAIRSQQAAEDVVRDAEAAAALRRGQELLAAGKLGVAKIYFQAAVKQSKPESEIHGKAEGVLGRLEAKAGSEVAGR